MKLKPKKMSYADTLIEYLNMCDGHLTTNVRGQDETLEYPDCGWSQLISYALMCTHGRFNYEYDPEDENRRCPCCGSKVANGNGFIVKDEHGDEIDLLLCKRCACALIPWLMMVSKGDDEYYSNYNKEK